MFGEQFYPTPMALIQKMISPIYNELSQKGVAVLEPSAGKGNILDYLTGYEEGSQRRSYDWTCQKSNVYACEIDPELALILQGKGYKVIESDFLKYKGNYWFTHILMNPPFAQGAKHLLKAWEIMRTGKIVCVLNAETVRNAYSQERKQVASLIEQYGSVEFLSEVFTQAERRTRVEIALVRLEKKSEETEFDFFSNLEKGGNTLEIPEDFIQNELARRDVVGNMLIRYEQSQAAFLEYLKAKAALEHSLSGINSQILDKDDHRYIQVWDLAMKGDTNQQRFNIFVDSVKTAMWETLFTVGEFQKLMTSRVRERFQQFRSAQGAMEFNRENVAELFNILLLNQQQLLEDCILNVFDEFCRYDDSNREHVEGWKSNDAYKVNRRIVLPCFLERFNDWQLTWERKGGLIGDIDKALCFLTGRNIDQVLTVTDALSIRFRELNNYRADYKLDSDDQLKKYHAEQPGQFEKTDFKVFSTFFECRFFKKGTLHLIWRDTALLDQFNRAVAKARGWIPEETKGENVFGRRKGGKKSVTLFD